jgi:predicted DsbA family dithiol-disulfide isomerase
MTEKTTISIDIISDVMCPWCYVGHKRLEKAISTLDDIDVEISWRPFQLDPTLPREGKDRQTYLNEKFGGKERAAGFYAQIEGAGKEEGIPFNFDAIKVSPNTLDAHRIIRWAASAGKDVQEKVVRRLFQLYFEEGANIADHEVLIKAARDAGMDSSIVETLLPTDADRDAVISEIRTAQQMGVSGVPCFIFEGRYAVMGAQDATVLADAISQITEAKEHGEFDNLATS